METTFYLNINTIYFCFTNNKTKIRKSTRKKIDPKKWGVGFPLQKKETKELRDTLTYYKKNVDSYINEVVKQKKRYPTKYELSEYIKILTGNKVKSDLVTSLIYYYLDYCKKHFAKKTIQTKTIHLNHFRKHTKNLEIHDLNKAVFIKYINNLIGKKVEVETINTYIKDIKAMFNFLYEHEKLEIDYSHNRFLKKYSVKSKPVIALLQNELEILEAYELNSTRLQKVIDLFLFGCYTALRYEDLNSFTIQNVEGAKQIQIKKTGQLLNIPIIPEALRILEKYNYKLPKLSNQKANDYLKEAFKQYYLNRQVTINKQYINRIESETMPLYEVISFHKSRKTFITTALRRGLDKRIVMQLAGIKTDSVFRRYADYQNNEGQQAMSEMFSKGVKKPLSSKEYVKKMLVEFKTESTDMLIEADLSLEDLQYNLVQLKYKSDEQNKSFDKLKRQAK